jgi:hypothetical protein
MRDESSVCTECGALGGLCREKFDSMIAFEFEDPVVFDAVHHITVICFNLQHSSMFSDESLSWMRSTARAIVEEGLSPIELRERSRKMFSGKVKVLRNTPKTPSKIAWSMTVLDIRTDNSDAYIKDVTTWAKSILKDMKTE